MFEKSTLMPFKIFQQDGKHYLLTFLGIAQVQYWIHKKAFEYDSDDDETENRLKIQET